MKAGYYASAPSLTSFFFFSSVVDGFHPLPPAGLAAKRKIVNLLNRLPSWRERAIAMTPADVVKVGERTQGERSLLFFFILVNGAQHDARTHACMHACAYAHTHARTHALMHSIVSAWSTVFPGVKPSRPQPRHSRSGSLAYE